MEGGRGRWMLEQALQALEAGQVETAEAILQQIAGADGGTVGGLAWAYLGRIHMLRFDVEAAQAALDRALQQAPHHFVVRLERGVFFMRLGLDPQAIPELEAAFRSAPNGSARAHADRLLQRAVERSRGAFVRRALLPDLSRVLRPFRRRTSEASGCSWGRW